MKKIKITVAILLVASSVMALTKKTKPVQPPDVKSALQKLMPKGWQMEVVEKASPLMWRSSMACVSYRLTNPTVTHKHEIGGFDYNPFHEFWLCPADYNGVQDQLGMVEQKYPARYVADGPNGVLFHLSMGENDWGSALDDLVKAIGFEKPEMKQAECDKVQKALGAIQKPKGINLMCSMTTSTSIFVELDSIESDDIKEINGWTDVVGKTMKKSFPKKSRVIVSRRWGMNTDSVVVPYKPIIR